MLKGKDNKITAIDGTGSSVGIIAAWVHKFVLGVESQPGRRRESLREARDAGCQPHRGGRAVDDAPSLG